MRVPPSDVRTLSRVLGETRSSASRHGHCDPLWLRTGRPPPFEATAGGVAGPEILLFHGLFGALSNWDTVFPLFCSFARPIAFEFPILTGHRSEVRVKSLAAYAELFLRSRGGGPAVLCGNSLGGHVALRLCLASPELVDCLVLTGTSGLYEHTVDSLPVRPDERFVREHMARVFYDQRFVTDEAIKTIADTLRNRHNVLNLIHAARSAKRDNLLDLLGEIRVPTLLLWGEDDAITTMDVAETFHRHIPGSELRTVARCGHAPMIEHPEWFSGQVRDFLRRHGRISSPAPENS